MNLLKKLITFLPKGHQDAIREIMATIRANSELNTDREIQFEAKRLVDRVRASQKISSPIIPLPGDVIDSRSHNQNIEGAFIDLKALYAEAGHLGNIHNKQKVAIDSEFNKARSAIFKLLNDARVFAIRNRKPEYDDIKLINFSIDRNATQLSPASTIDGETRILKLPEIAKVRQHLARRGTKITKTSAVVQANAQIGQLSKQFDTALATDGKTESFWAEVILADSPVQTHYTRWGVDTNSPLTHETISGPIARFNIDFGNAEPVNQVKVLPFAPHPVRIVEISYRPSKSSRIRFPINNFVSETSLDWVEFNFDTVFCSDIEIVFTQESYRDFIVHVPKHVLFATDFLSRLLSERGRELKNVPDIKDINLGGNYEIYEEAMSDLSGLLSSKELVKSPSTEIDLAGKYIMSLGETLANFSPELQGLLQDVSTYTSELPEETGAQIETFNKVEYIIGAREIQANYVVYAPRAIYESEKFQPAATISNVEFEVDERHPIVFGDYGPEKRTSTEWSIELSEDRILPIFPSNQVTDGFLRVQSERLNVSSRTKKGNSRFPAFISHLLLKENNLILIDNVDYSVDWENDSEGRLVVTIFDDTYDRNKLYTIDYFASPSSKSIDVLSRFRPKRVPKPESFEGTDNNQKIATKYYPSINYGIVNSENFVSTNSVYRYTAPSGAYEFGTVLVEPTWIGASGAVISSGNKDVLTWSGANFNTLDAAHLLDPFGLYIKLDEIPNAIYELSAIVNSGNLTMKNQPILYTGDIGLSIDSSYFSGNLTDYSTGYTGAHLTGALRLPYSIEIVYSDGDEIFGFDFRDYQPIKVSVGGQPAKNITNYTDLEQPAFVITEGFDNQFEYIHDGRFLYFNQTVSETEIQVDYKWLTKYIKVNCTMYSNKIINPNVSPQVNEYKLLLNTTVL